jgi:hypothetical protein
MKIIIQDGTFRAAEAIKTALRVNRVKDFDITMTNRKVFIDDVAVKKSKAAKPEHKALFHSPEFTVSFPALFAPRSFCSIGKPKYSVTMKFKNKIDADVLRAELRDRAESLWGGEMPEYSLSPIKHKDDFGWHATASSNFKPVILDEKGNEIKDPFYLQAGDRAIATISLYPWTHPHTGEKGMSICLHAITKVGK